MKQLIAVLCLASLIISISTVNCPVRAEEAEQSEQSVEKDQGITVAEYAVCEDVVERQPVNAQTAFPSSIGKVFFWTTITGAKEPTEIKHVWYHEGIQIADVTLTIQYPQHRTWSYKTIMPEWTGNWSVEVLDSNAKVLKKVNFTIGAEPENKEELKEAPEEETTE